jgi:pimeloyl-ACP methyl ester carboxylesterase
MKPVVFPFALFPTAAPDSFVGETVVLLHGLGLRSWAMARLARALRADGYRVINLTYPSRTMPLEELAGTWLPAQLQAAGLAAAVKVNFVTHSMGGIVVRFYLRYHPAHLPGRVVMIAPPNQGSEVVDHLRGFAPFRWFTGLNGRRLGTDAASAPHQLGPWPAGAGELGIIAGDRTFNPLFSAWLGGPNDGKVSVARARLEGMSDFIVLPHSHTWLQWAGGTAGQVKAFLRGGKFAPVRPVQAAAAAGSARWRR